MSRKVSKQEMFDWYRIDQSEKTKLPVKFVPFFKRQLEHLKLQDQKDEAVQFVTLFTEYILSTAEEVPVFQSGTFTKKDGSKITIHNDEFFRSSHETPEKWS